MTLNEFGDVVWVLEVNVSSQSPIPCFFMYVPDVKYYTDYNQTRGKVIHEYHHRRKGSLPFFDLNFWAENHQTEKDCRCLQNCIQTVENAALLNWYQHRTKRLRGELTRKKNIVQLSKRRNPIPVIQVLILYHWKLQ